MVLVKENAEKQRKVFKDGDAYIKVWQDVGPSWISQHVRTLRQIVPGIVEDYGGNWIRYSEVPGVPASTVEHTDEFINQIYQFCLDSVEHTSPYVHGDWVLSNIIVQPDGTFKLIDWDNIGIYPQQDYIDKLHRDLHSAFGDRFYTVTGNK